MSLVDLHLHLLPGVDDGARTLEESVEFARRMVADGVVEATVTPHVGSGLPYDPLTIPGRTADLRAALEAERIPLRLRPGGELHPSGARRIGDTLLRGIAQGPRGSRWILFEVPFTGIDDEFLRDCRLLRRRGYGILIAHPERAAGFTDGGLDRLRAEIEAGSLLQVNASSLNGDHGPEAQLGGEALVRAGLAFVIASDAHPGTRELTLGRGEELLRALGLTPVAAARLASDNPRFLLEQGIPRLPRWLDDLPARLRAAARAV